MERRKRGLGPPEFVRPVPAIRNAVICHAVEGEPDCETRLAGHSCWCACGRFYLWMRPVAVL